MRFAVLPVVALVPMILAACQPATAPQTEAPAENATRTAATDAAVTEPMLGAVNLNQPLRALGTEPFWSLNVDKNALAYSSIDVETPITGQAQAPEVTANSAVWRATLSDGSAVVLTLSNTECSDGMSDRTYALTAKVELAGQVLNGCAASVAGLEAAGESGHVK